MKKKMGILLLILVVFSGGLVFLYITQTANKIALIDSHVLIECFCDEDSLKIERRLLLEMRKENIAKMVLTGAMIKDHIIDTMIMNMAERHPDRFIPFLSGFVPNASSTPAYIETQLQTGKWKGIGKVMFSHILGEMPTYMPNDSMLLEIYGLADEYNVPVFFHIDVAVYEEGCKKPVDALKEIFTLFPNVTFIWHAGQLACEGFDPEQGCNLSLEDYPNVVSEAEFHHEDMNLSSYEFSWQLIHENRHVVGSDLIISADTAEGPVLYTAGETSYHETIQQTREVLSKYSDETIRDIGYNNILSVLGMI